MNDDGSHNWLKLLLRWITGEATSKDENSLNHLAKEDPFLADALEGYRSFPEAKHAQNLTRVKTAIRNKYRKRKPNPAFYLVRVAAVGILLFGAWYAFQFFSEKENSSISLVQDKGQAESPGRFEDTTARHLTQETEMDNDKIVVIEDQGQNAPDEKRKQLAGSSQAEKVTSPVLPPPQAEKTNLQKDNPSGELLATEDKLTTTVQKLKEEQGNNYAKKQKAQNPEGQYAISEAPELAPAEADEQEFMVFDGERPAVGNAAMGQTITGQVVNSIGAPLAGAEVRILNTQQGGYTDIRGQFSLASATHQPTVKVNYDGYAEQQLVIRDNAFLNIQLVESNNDLESLELTSARAKRKREDFKNNSCTPRGGYKSYNKYVLKQLQKFSQSKGVRSKGLITVSFVLDQKGKPTDLQVLQSLGEAYDVEIFRIIEEGVKWNGESGVRTTYTIEVD